MFSGIIFRYSSLILAFLILENALMLGLIVVCVHNYFLFRKVDKRLKE